MAMVLETVQQNWAMVLASVLAGAVLLFVLYRVWTDSARGRFRAARRVLVARESEVNRRRHAVGKVSKTLARLRSKADKTRPRAITEAAGALEDAKSLQKIAEDQVLIARNHVRKIIFEEFPPKVQARLRARYLDDPDDDGKPFSF